MQTWGQLYQISLKGSKFPSVWFCFIDWKTSLWHWHIKTIKIKKTAELVERDIPYLTSFHEKMYTGTNTRVLRFRRRSKWGLPFNSLLTPCSACQRWSPPPQRKWSAICTADVDILVTWYLAIRDAAMSRLSTASGRLAVPPLPTCALECLVVPTLAPTRWCTAHQEPTWPSAAPPPTQQRIHYSGHP